jgi:hypothetical protein
MVHALSSISKKIKSSRVLIKVDTNVEEVSSLPYYKKIVGLFDEIYKISFLGSRYVLKYAGI